MTDEAVGEQIKSLQLSGTPPQVIDSFRQAYGRGGFAAYLNAVLELMRTLESQSIYVSPYYKAVLYAKLDDREQAMRCLQKAFDEHIRYVAYIDVDPSFDNLREEPRFQELRRRLGLQA